MKSYVCASLLFFTQFTTTGKSEQLLGRFIAEYPGSDKVRSNLHVATKFAAYPWRVFPSNVVAACKGSLRRLGADQLSIGQLHWSTANYQPLQVRAGRGSTHACKPPSAHCTSTAAF